METAQLKTDIHLLVEQVEDNNLLKEVYLLLYQNSSYLPSDFILNETQKNLLNEAINEYKANPELGLSWQEVKKGLKK